MLPPGAAAGPVLAEGLRRRPAFPFAFGHTVVHASLLARYWGTA
jgi:hypothetical protein